MGMGISRLRMLPIMVVAALLPPLWAEPSGAWAQSPPKEIEYAFPQPSVWTTRLDPHGDPDNPLLPFVAALFDQVGIPWHAKSYPTPRMFENLQTGVSEFALLVNAPSLQTCCLIGKHAVATAEVRVYWLPSAVPIRTIEDLVGKDVITISGYSYASLMSVIKDPANRITSHPAKSHDAAFAMLGHERADYLLDYEGPASETLAAHPISGIKSQILDHLDVYLVLARSYPNAEAVLEKLESAAVRLRADSTHHDRKN